MTEEAQREAPMRVLFVDDHALVREGVRLVLERLPEIEIMDEAGSLGQARRLLAEHRYELILLDYHLPDLSDTGTVGELVAELPNTKIVILSGDREPELARQLLAAGVRGFIPKQTNADVMLAALLVVLRGGTYVPPEALSAHPAPADPSVLTGRQRQVLGLLAQGLTNKEIAGEIAISESTVRVHVSAILRALQVDNRTQACQIAVRNGWVDPQ
jgi:DNA-binding NarL/FixJ family response regulator